MFALLNCIYFVTDSKVKGLSRDTYHLSQDEVQNFPFCVMSINMTRITLQLLREGKLNRYVDIM